MSEREPLPPAPRDARGRFHAERGTFGDLLWVRPGDLVEMHPCIVHFQPRDAVDELVTWARQPWGGREFLLGLHHQAFGPPLASDANAAWEHVLRDLEEAFTSGWLVIHAERLPAISPGREPVSPGVSPRPPASPTMGDGAGEPEEPFDADLWSFQRRHGLSDSGYLDRSTIQSIVAIYGH